MRRSGHMHEAGLPSRTAGPVVDRKAWPPMPQFVYEFISRDEAQRGPSENIVKVMWVRNNKGTEECPEARCLVVAKALGCVHRSDGVFAGIPSLTIVKLFLFLHPEQ